MRKYYWWIEGILLLLFLLLIFFVYYNPISIYDVSVSQGMQGFGNTLSMRSPMQAVSWLGSFAGGTIMVVIAAIIYYLANRKKEALFIVLTPLAVGFNYLVKLMVARPRPDSFFVQKYAIETDASFPSAHVVFLTVFFGFVIYTAIIDKNMSKLVRTLVLIFSSFMIVLIGISRMYLGVHWFSDVLGGYLFGGMMFVALIYFFNRSKLAKAS